MDSFTVFVVRDLLSWIDRRFHTDERPRRRAVLGASDGGNIALYQAVRYPGAFGLVAAQSSNVLPEVEEEYRSAGSLPGKIYLDIGVFDIPVLVPRVRNLKATLESRGGTVCFVELHDGHSWGSWRSRLRELLVFLFTQS
jgi:enterochelin esterase family protein